MGEPGEGFEELARFWLVAETLHLVKSKPLKLKVNHLLLRPLPPWLGKGPPRKDRLLDAILLDAPFDLVFVFELLQISSSNLLPTSP